MTNGLDPAFEQTIQIVSIVGDSDVILAAQDAIFVVGNPVPATAAYLVERIAVRYRPGTTPTSPYVPLTIGVTGPTVPLAGPGPAQIREGINLYPPTGWANPLDFNALEAFADEASPIRFWPNEQVVCKVPVYGDATHQARVTVIMQTRIVRAVNLGAAAGETTPVDPVLPASRQGPDPDSWG